MTDDVFRTEAVTDSSNFLPQTTTIRSLGLFYCIHRAGFSKVLTLALYLVLSSCMQASTIGSTLSVPWPLFHLPISNPAGLLSGTGSPWKRSGIITKYPLAANWSAMSCGLMKRCPITSVRLYGLIRKPYPIHELRPRGKDHTKERHSRWIYLQDSWCRFQSHSAWRCCRRPLPHA